MSKRSKLSKTKQRLVTDYLDLVRMLARYFVQNRPQWQRSLYVDDLEGEGFLALCKAARTYDPKRLPYPKAYFARAILNAMLKWIKKATRTPRENRIALADAADQMPEYDELDHLRLAIEALPEDDREMAANRFMHGMTLRSLAETHHVPIRVASMSAQRLARTVSGSLDIRLSPRSPAAALRKGEATTRQRSGGSPCKDVRQSSASSHRGRAKK
jgi:RNA polymerase sigma factor (sigma-70 family)